MAHDDARVVGRDEQARCSVGRNAFDVPPDGSPPKLSIADGG